MNDADGFEVVQKKGGKIGNSKPPPARSDWHEDEPTKGSSRC